MMEIMNTAQEEDYQFSAVALPSTDVNRKAEPVEITPAIQAKMDDLPMMEMLPEVVESVKQNQATVIIGATGSGKTTLTGLHLLRSGLAVNGRIGVTQPRRLAVISLAEFVSGLYGCQVGAEVGYQIRFDDTTMEGTRLKFMTDGILLQEASADPLFSKYDVLIFDEAHEQGLNTDIGLGLVKRALKQRPDLRVIVMSATIDTGRFSEYFDKAPIIEVPGRSFPIETEYLQAEEMTAAMKTFEEEGETASVTALAAYKARQIHQSGREGHVLIFMPGKKEIAQTIEKLQSFGLPEEKFLPLAAHSEMDAWEQQRIFEPTSARKVIVATNIAETSITVDGLSVVIDSGLIKEMTYDHRHGFGALKTIEHSKAGLKQRQGRAGRTQPGLYLPLFTEEEYETGRLGFLPPGVHKRPEFSTPEIQREDLSSAVLRMTELGIPDIEQFEFMNQPAKGAIHNAIQALKVLGALDDKKQVTEIGQQMARLPVEPRIARMILAAQKYGCVKEILLLAACLSTGPVFTRPIGEELAADAAKEMLQDKRGDLFTLLKIVPLYEKQPEDMRASWAMRNYLNHHILEEVLKIRQQLTELADWLGIQLTSAEEQFRSLGRKEARRGEYGVIGRALTAGLIQNLAARSGKYEYTRLNGHEVRLHPGSVWFKQLPILIVCTEILEINNRQLAVNVQAVDVEWLKEIAPHLLKIKKEPLHHTFKGGLAGTYTVVYVNGVEIGRQFGRDKVGLLSMEELERMERQRGEELRQGQDEGRGKKKKKRSREGYRAKRRLRRQEQRDGGMDVAAGTFAQKPKQFRGQKGRR